MLYDKELLNRPKILIVTKLDKKGATSKFQELKQGLNSVREHGKANAEWLSSFMEKSSYLVIKLGKKDYLLSWVRFRCNRNVDSNGKFFLWTPTANPHSN